ncbi:MAG: hypothetical protein WA265_19030, partial [Rhodomicrobium sp.]
MVESQQARSTQWGLPFARLYERTQQLRQLGELRRHAAGLVPREQLGRRAPTGLVLEIEIAERLPARVP